MARGKANKRLKRSGQTVRQAANQLDYRKVIVPREFDKDWRPKDPRRVLPRMRNVAAFANR
jgi:hypothetical protein